MPEPIDELLIKISADVAGLKSALDKAQEHSSNTAEKIGSHFELKLTAAILVAEVALEAFAKAFEFVKDVTFDAVKEQYAAVDSITTLSDRIGVTTESLVALGQMGEKTGTDVNEMAAALRHLQTELSGATDKNSDAAMAFEHLGLSVADLQRMTPDQQLLAVSEALSKVSDRADQTATGMEILGRNSQAVVGALKGGSKAFEEAKDEAEKTGQAFSNFDGERIKEATGAVRDLKDMFEGVMRTLAIESAPWLTAVAKLLKDLIGDTHGFRDAIKTMIDYILKGVGYVADYFQLLRIEWLTAKAVWNEVSLAVLKALDYWKEPISMVASTFKNMWNVVVADWNLVKQTFLLGISFINDKFHGFATGVKIVFSNMLIEIGTAMYRIKGLADAADSVVEAGYAMGRSANQTQEEAHQQFLKVQDDAVSAAADVKKAWTDLFTGERSVKPIDWSQSVKEAEDAAIQSRAVLANAMAEPWWHKGVEKWASDIKQKIAEAAQVAAADAKKKLDEVNETKPQGLSLDEQKKLKALRDGAREALEVEQEAYDQKIQMLRDFEAKELGIKITGKETEAELNEMFYAKDAETAKRYSDLKEKLEVQHQKRMRQLYGVGEKSKIDLTKGSWAQQAQFIGDAMTSILNNVHAHSKKEFEIKKKLSVASAIVQTAAGATLAFQQYGYPFGLVAAAQIIAAGAAQIATINGQQFDGGGAAAAPAVGAAPNPSATTGGAAAQAAPEKTITVNVIGSGRDRNMIRDLIAELSDAMKDSGTKMRLA